MNRYILVPVEDIEELRHAAVQASNLLIKQGDYLRDINRHIDRSGAELALSCALKKLEQLAKLQPAEIPVGIPKSKDSPCAMNGSSTAPSSPSTTPASS